MKKNKFKALGVAIITVGIISCSYDYEFPDYTNAYPYYRTTALSERMKEHALNEIINHGYELNHDYPTWRWDLFVTERDSANNILYQGIPRLNSDKRLRLLSVNSYVTGSIKKETSSYQRCLIMSSVHYTLELTTEGQISNELPISNGFYTYKINRGFFTIDVANSLGFSLADAETYVTEKDKSQRVLAQFHYNEVDDNLIVSMQGAESIDIRVEIYGWHQTDKAKHDKILIGNCLFKDIPIKEVNGKTLNLSDYTDYVFEKAYKFYVYAVDRSQVPVIAKCKELGFNLADIKMHITEKDEFGNILRTSEETNHNIRAVDSAEYIDVEIQIFGWRFEDKTYRNKMEVGSFWFKNIRLADINNSTLVLSTDMDYVFIPR